MDQQQNPQNVVSLRAARELKNAQLSDPAYESKIARMEKADLLEEMVAYQEERSRIGHLTPDLMVRGRILFKALEESSVTDELRNLTGCYRRHLEFELQEYLKSHQVAR